MHDAFPEEYHLHFQHQRRVSDSPRLHDSNLSLSNRRYQDQEQSAAYYAACGAPFSDKPSLVIRRSRVSHASLLDLGLQIALSINWYSLLEEHSATHFLRPARVRTLKTKPSVPWRRLTTSPTPSVPSDSSCGSMVWNSTSASSAVCSGRSAIQTRLGNQHPVVLLSGEGTPLRGRDGHLSFTLLSGEVPIVSLAVPRWKRVTSARKKGGDPRTDHAKKGDDSDPGLASRRESDLTATKRGTLKPAKDPSA